MAILPLQLLSYSDAMRNTYITEAIQSGNHKQYCADKNIPYAAFRKKQGQYNQVNDREIWSPNSQRRLIHICNNRYTGTESGNINNDE